jgi:SAM-dependent methyltransferase
MAPASTDAGPSQALIDVREFWEAQACGEVYGSGPTQRQWFASHAAARYALEPYIPEFARFPEGSDRDVLEIGVGLGADHAEWAKSSPRSLTGIDLTDRAVTFTRERFVTLGLTSALRVANAERLPFPDESFDLVYSWGVLHHSPDTVRAIQEVWRVLRPGGTARIMVYHRYAVTGYLLWLRYALLKGRPRTSLEAVYARCLESPGTKAFSTHEAEAMFARFARVYVSTRLSFGDLLQGAVGQRHRGPLLSLAKRLWPRWLIRRVLARHGLLLLIDATK